MNMDRKSFMAERKKQGFPRSIWNPVLKQFNSLHVQCEWIMYQAALASKTVDLWAMVPEELIEIDDEVELGRRELVVEPDGFWHIESDGLLYPLASGYNCDPSRNGEVMVWVEEECPRCKGEGVTRDAGCRTCTYCQGTGKIRRWEEKG